MRSPTPPQTSQSKENRFIPRKWLTLLCLLALLISSIGGFYFVWGALFIFWAINSLIIGEVYLIEPISRNEDPILFWGISLMWLGFGLLYLVADILPG